MDTNFDIYIDEGTAEIQRILSSNDIDREEKDEIVKAFTSELVRCISDTKSLIEYDHIFSDTSIVYNDRCISALLSTKRLTSSAYNEILKKCQSQKKIFGKYVEKNWVMPQLSNTNIEICENTAQKCRDADELLNRVCDVDKEIEKISDVAERDLDINACDKALELLNELNVDLELCKANEIEFPELINSDIASTSKKINLIKDKSIQKDKLCRTHL